MKEQEVIELIKSALSDSFYGEERFEFFQEERFDTYRPDLIIKAGKKQIAAIEIKNESNLTKALTTFTTDFYFLFKVRYFIYTDGVRFFIFDRFSNPRESIKTDIEAFVKRISRLRSDLLLNNLKSSAAKIIIEKIRESSDQFPQLSKYFEDYGNKIARQFKLSSNYALYFEGVAEDTDSFEHQFFRNLLGNNLPDTIYRYCPFNRVFQILNENTIAMLGLPGMNDTTEPNYVDNYLNDLDNEPWEMPPQSRAAINRRFIMSCTTLPDDLMQWRLYGEDGKGACIKFETKKLLNISQQFYLSRVKYADENNDHPELIFIRDIIREIKQKLLFDIKFTLLYVWRHFFKPREYAYEQEIRLLYIHKKTTSREKKWILAEPYSIVNPMVIFNLSKNEFPLKVIEVMLGPKRPESKLNKSQLEQMISETNKKVIISESKLNVYR